MQAWQALWHDDRGAVLSAEMVLVGTLGVVGATVGLKAVADSVNGELIDVARALRSLDQSYAFRGIEGCGASTAGSAFQQEPVAQSLEKLDDLIEDLRESEADDDDEPRKQQGTAPAGAAAPPKAAERKQPPMTDAASPSADPAAGKPMGGQPPEKAPAKPAPKKKPKEKTEVIL